MSQWYDGTGRGELACPNCGRSEAVNVWRHDPPFAFACFGVAFWNWPPLRPEFIARIEGITGHEFRVIKGKL